ncbi:MAG: hypothetical protein WAN76_26500 [Candidatus Sulfotelmatobacter sp.]
MTLVSTPVLATSAKALTRSLLFALGIDHVLIDFLGRAAIGDATVLLALLFVGIRLPRRSKAAIRRTTR